MNLRTIYLDYNATTPVAPELKALVPEWLASWGNPSSIHWAGRGPKGILRDARRQIAAMIGAEALELVFTSGGSEANNLALQGVLRSLQSGKSSRKQLIISAVEHPSVTQTALNLRRQGFRVDIVPVNRDGKMDLATYQSLLSQQTALVSVMYANNETGHIFPVQKMAKMAHDVGALFHCDAVQAMGKVPIDLHQWGVDLASLSGHKFYSLKGCGILYCRKGLQIESLIHGGGQERGRRAGTENVLAIASLGAMSTRAKEILEASSQIRILRDHFEARLLKEISDLQIAGPYSERLHNTSKVLIAGVDGETLLMNLDVRGFAISTGAACSAGNPEPSPALLAMGFTRAEAQSSLRVSLGWFTTLEEVDLFVDALVSVVARLRSFRHGEQFAYGI